MIAVASSRPAPRWLHIGMICLALALAAVHTTAAVMQQSMNEDGISYLDLGDAWLDGDVEAAINGIWSPAYAVLIATAVRIVDPSVDREFPTVQVVNWFVYALALLAFGFFWRQLTARYYAGTGHETVPFPPALWVILGYSLFIWSSLDLIEIWAVTPDMAVAAVVYLAAGCMLRIDTAPSSLRPMMLLGMLLGFGFFVKAAVLPLGLAALVPAALSTPGPTAARVGRLLAGLAALLLVAAPLIGALSWKAGHFTTGDVGRFAYLKHVNEMPYPDFHEAAERLEGEPAHPPRRIFDEPPVFAFGGPVAGTYPMAYDPGYWTQGLEPEVTLQGQARALITSGMRWFDLFVREQGGFLALVLLLGCMRAPRSAPWRLDGGHVLALWSLAAFGLYSLVYVETRYVAPFVVLFWAAVLAGLRFPAGTSSRRLAATGALLLALFVWLNLAALNLDGLGRVTGFTPLDEAASQPGAEAGTDTAADHPRIARELARLGLENGDPIGVIGYAYSAYWARLAGLRIVAEIHWHDGQRFWASPDATRAQALDAFAEAGAVAVVAEPVSRKTPEGWIKLGETGYLVHLLRD